jgi:hypothetical protein
MGALWRVSPFFLPLVVQKRVIPLAPRGSLTAIPLLIGAGLVQLHAQLTIQ